MFSGCQDDTDAEEALAGLLGDAPLHVRHRAAAVGMVLYRPPLVSVSSTKLRSFHDHPDLVSNARLTTLVDTSVVFAIVRRLTRFSRSARTFS